jgi:hypothetical protein
MYKMAPNYLRHALVKFDTEPRPFDTPWHEFCRDLGTTINPTWHWRSSSPKHITARDSHEKARIWSREEILHGTLAKIGMLGQLNRRLDMSRSDPPRVWPRRARHELRSARSRAQPHARAWALAYKKPQPSALPSCTPHTLLPATERR